MLSFFSAKKECCANYALHDLRSEADNHPNELGVLQIQKASSLEVSLVNLSACVCVSEKRERECPCSSRDSVILTGSCLNDLLI